MSRRIAVNYVLGFVLILIFVSGVRMSLEVADKYGWTYNRTIIIATDVVTEEVSVQSQVFSEVFLLLIGIVLITTGRQLSSHTNIKSIYRPSSSSEIVLTGRKPKHWDVCYDPKGGIIVVLLDEVGISLPLDMIKRWMEETPSEAPPT